jgi:hypothetical protein
MKKMKKKRVLFIMFYYLLILKDEEDQEEGGEGENVEDGEKNEGLIFNNLLINIFILELSKKKSEKKIIKKEDGEHEGDGDGEGEGEDNDIVDFDGVLGEGLLFFYYLVICFLFFKMIPI